MTRPDGRGENNAPCTARTSVGAAVVAAVAIAMAFLILRWLG
jgi:hypothetical protein